MWTHEKRNRTREGLSKIVWASVTGAVAGASIGVLERMATGKPSIRVRATDLFLLGGTYALAETAIETWRPNTPFTPALAGCAAGIISSRGGTKSIITASILATTFGYIFENRDRVFQNKLN